MSAIAVSNSQEASRLSTRGFILSTYTVLFLLVFVLGGLAASVTLSGAVVTSGRFVVSSYTKPVQHLKGGTVDTIMVSNGDKVTAGQTLIRLDDTQTKANLEIIEKRINEFTVRGARLMAEESGAASVQFPDMITEKAKTRPEIAAMIAGETRLFEARRLSQQRSKDQLSERIAQYSQQIEGLNAQIAGKKQEIALIRKEMEGVGELVSKELLSVTRLTELQRQEAQLQGQLGGLIASVAETRGRITETRLQRLQIDDDIRSQASSDLRDIQAEKAEYDERWIAAEDDLKHIDITAPQDGVVQGLAVHSAGAVIGAGSTIMAIVPVDDRLVAEVRAAPKDIDQLEQGQRTMLRLSAFNQRVTPEIKGHIIHISADLTSDQRTGESFYLVRLAIDDGELAKLDGLSLAPGMPVEAFIQTGQRTILSYLLKPATDQIKRAFREE